MDASSAHTTLAQCAQAIVRIYSQRTTRAELNEAFERVKPEIEFIDPLVHVVGKANYEAQFRSLRMLFRRFEPTRVQIAELVQTSAHNRGGSAGAMSAGATSSSSTATTATTTAPTRHRSMIVVSMEIDWCLVWPFAWRVHHIIMCDVDLTAGQIERHRDLWSLTSLVQNMPLALMVYSKVRRITGAVTSAVLRVAMSKTSWAAPTVMVSMLPTSSGSGTSGGARTSRQPSTSTPSSSAVTLPAGQGARDAAPRERQDPDLQRERQALRERQERIEQEHERKQRDGRAERDEEELEEQEREQEREFEREHERERQSAREFETEHEQQPSGRERDGGDSQRSGGGGGGGGNGGAGGAGGGGGGGGKARKGRAAGRAATTAQR